MACPANIREVQLAMGIVPQSDLATANIAADLWSLTKTNAAFIGHDLASESDAQDLGKGHEFATQTFPTSSGVQGPYEKYLSSEWAAWLFAFAFGNMTRTTSGTGKLYTSVPSDPSSACLDLPPFTLIEKIRSSTEMVMDVGYVGCVINGWTLALKSGTGRANATLNAEIVGSGKVSNPAGLTMPTVETEHFLNAGSATITINGVDYTTAKTFLSLEVSYRNNVRMEDGIFPGSGTQNGYAIRGRMEHGDRELGLSFVARLLKDSAEYTKLLAGTTGTASVIVAGATIGAGPTTHKVQIDFPKIQYSAVARGEQNGIVTVAVAATPLWDSVTSKIIETKVTCDRDDIYTAT
jgi:hypothetical protein